MAAASARLAPGAARAVTRTLFAPRSSVGPRCIAPARVADRAVARALSGPGGLAVRAGGSHGAAAASFGVFARGVGAAASCRRLLAPPLSRSFAASVGDASDDGFRGSKEVEDLPSSPPFPGTPRGLPDTIAPESPLHSPAPHFTAHTEAEWREVDAKVNEYPLMRSFVAVGTGGEAFVTDVAAVVGQVLGREVGGDAVSSRPSKRGTYVSATVGPVRVDSPDQIVEIFRALKQDPRLKFYL